MYLGEGTPYVPGDCYLRAQVLQWLFFEQYSHEPYIAVVRYWLTVAASRRSEEEIEARRAGGRAALAAMERHLATRTYLVGEAYSVADTALYAYTHVADEGGFELAHHPSVCAWLGRVASQPGHVSITHR
jgi:glutathione S-transferase